MQKAQTSGVQTLNRAGTITDDDPDEAQTYTSNYTYAGPRPHAPTEIDDTLLDNPTRPVPRTLHYDPSGNQTGWVHGLTGNDRRTVGWTEADRIEHIEENGHLLASMLYDGSGERAVKKTADHELQYFGQNFTLRDGEFRTRQVFAGGTRIASKLGNGGDERTLYFHDDHLGSTNFLTDDSQTLVAHEEYFPTGELWVDEASDPSHLDKPYLFTGKELDTETGLYYFGARYYDPHLSMWNSPDPALPDHMFGASHGGEGPIRARDLASYTYAWNAPTTLRDPDGRTVEIDPRSPQPSRRKAFDAFQRLTRDKLMLQGDMVRIASTDNRSGSRETGTNLVRRLVGSQKNVRIFAFEGVSPIPGSDSSSTGNPQDVAAGRPTDANVQFDTRPARIFTTAHNGLTQVEDAPLHITLGHELIHADHILQGTFLPGRILQQFSFGGQSISYFDRLEEVQTIGLRAAVSLPLPQVTENSLRWESAVNPRVTTLSPDNPFANVPGAMVFTP